MKAAVHVATGLVALLAANAIASKADAAEWYGAVKVGQTQSSVEGIDLTDELAYGAAIGTSVGPVRVEAGVDHLAGSFANIVNADAFDYNATAYLDLPVGHNSSVFVGGGVDYIDGSASIYGSSIDASGEGYHWAVGAAHRFAPGVIGEVQWRQTTANLNTDFADGVDLDATEITAGLRFTL